MSKTVYDLTNYEDLKAQYEDSTTTAETNRTAFNST